MANDRRKSAVVPTVDPNANWVTSCRGCGRHIHGRGPVEHYHPACNPKVPARVEELKRAEPQPLRLTKPPPIPLKRNTTE